MKKLLCATLVAVAAMTAYAAAGPELAVASEGPAIVDDAVVNAKIDARLREKLAAALAERVRARTLAGR
jgi:redox-regulated HSP33 family molecular chaperone